MSFCVFVFSYIQNYDVGASMTVWAAAFEQMMNGFKLLGVVISEVQCAHGNCKIHQHVTLLVAPSECNVNCLLGIRYICFLDLPNERPDYVHYNDIGNGISGRERS